MENTFNEARLKAMLAAAKDCRMKQLESDFDAWRDYKEIVGTKADLTKHLEELLSDCEIKMLREYDDVTSLLMCKAQDFFYDRGFTDCMNLLRVALGGINEERK